MTKRGFSRLKACARVKVRSQRWRSGKTSFSNAGRETAAVRIGKSERARRIRNLWHHGKFDLKIGDCRERRTSSCAVLFSSDGGYRLYAVQVIEPSPCVFRKQVWRQQLSDRPTGSGDSGSSQRETRMH